MVDHSLLRALERWMVPGAERFTRVGFRREQKKRAMKGAMKGLI
jgi:hypothetical protein